MVDYVDPWDSNPETFKSKSAFFSILKSHLRDGVWKRWRLKTNFKNATCQRPPDYLKKNTRAKTGARCAISGRWVAKSSLQVDHIIGEASLRDWSDVEDYIKHLCCSKIYNGQGVVEPNYQLVSVEAHRIKTYSERFKVSMQDAEVRIQTLETLKKLKRNCPDGVKLADFEKQVLVSEGFHLSDVSTKNQRETCFAEIVKTRLATESILPKKRVRKS